MTFTGCVMRGDERDEMAIFLHAGSPTDDNYAHDAPVLMITTGNGTCLLTDEDDERLLYYILYMYIHVNSCIIPIQWLFLG